MTLATVGTARATAGLLDLPGREDRRRAAGRLRRDGLGTLQVLRFLRTLRGTHVGASCGHMRTARRVRISSDTPLPVHGDGEICSRTSASWRSRSRGRLRLLG